MDNFNERLARVAEGLLENEQLTADLDDAAAQALLDWGLNIARRAVRQTLGMDDLAAEDALYAPLRATRRLMRAVNKWVARQDILGEAQHSEMLAKVVSQAQIAYGGAYIPPTQEQSAQFLERRGVLASNPVGFILELQKLIEHALTEETL